MNAIEIHNLTKKYKNNRGIEDVSLTVNSGEIFGLLGPNGCGKTTTMKILTGLLFQDKGSVSFFGENTANNKKIMSQVGCMIEEPAFYPYLTAEENLKTLLELYRELTPKHIDDVLDMVGLAKYKNEPVGKFSMGMKQKLYFCTAILHNPKLLILDEPTNGLDISSTACIRKILKDFTKNGGTILLSSHIASEIEKACTSAAVMSDGKIIDNVKIDEAAAKYGSVEDYYLHLMDEEEDMQ